MSSLRLAPRFAAGVIAVLCTGALWATPAASWTNFADTTSEGSVTGARQYTLTSGDYTITVNGTPNADGSVTLGASSAETNNMGVILTATPSGAVYGTKVVSVMMDVGNLPAATAELLAINLHNENAEVELKRVVEDGTSSIQQQWCDSNGNNNGWGKTAWTPASRQILTVTYSGAANTTQGTATYLNGTTLISNIGGLKTTGTDNNISRIAIGENGEQSAEGMKLYGLYIFTSKLTDAQVSTETTSVVTAISATATPLRFAFSRADLTEDGNTMNVTCTNGGTSTTSLFEGTLGTNITRETEGSETTSTAFFKSVTTDTGSTLLTTNGYPMVQCKFVTNTNSTKDNEGWSIYLPFTPRVETKLTHVCPKLFVMQSSGAVQPSGDDNKKYLNYTVTLYSGSVDTATTTPMTVGTANGTTCALQQLVVNTQKAAFSEAITLTAGTTYTMKLEVTASSTGGGTYSGIAGVDFPNVLTVSDAVTWSTGWLNGAAAVFNADVILDVTNAATLTMDDKATLNALAVEDASANDVTPSLTFTGTGSLTSPKTTLNADTDVSAITASLGAVTLASGKTLTLSSLNQIGSSSGTGTLALNGDSEIANTNKLGSDVSLKVLSGTVSYTAGDSENGLSTGRLITVSGKNSLLKTTTKDAFGWNFTTADKQKLIVEQGGRVQFGSRETLKTPVELCAGHIILTEEDGSRALDFFDGDTSRVDVTVKAATGATTANPTLSTLTSTGDGNARKVNLRNGDLRVSVEANAKFQVNAELTSYVINGSTLGKLVKLGAGELELTGTTANSYTPGTEIQAGTLHLTESATLGSGAVTITSGATLLAEVATDATKTLSNNISGEGTVKKTGTGTLSLTGTVSAPVELAAGTLVMPLPASALTVTPSGSEEKKLVLVLTDTQAAEETTTTLLTWIGDVSQVEVRNSANLPLPKTVSKADDSDVLVLTTRSTGTVTWSTGATSWAEGLSGFASGDNVTFGGNEADEDISVPAQMNVGEMTVSGKYTFTVVPGGLTASQVTVSENGTAIFNRKPVNYVRLRLANANGGSGANAVPGVSELILMKGDTVVAWPLGTTIWQLNPDGTTTDPTWAAGGNENVNALIDGVWVRDGATLTYTNPYDGSTGAYSNVEIANNKWWPHKAAGAYAVIHLGAPIDFDGYKLMTTDHPPRSARDWTLEISEDGTTWGLADSRTNWAVPAFNSFYVYEGTNTVFPVSTINAPITVSTGGTLGGSATIAGDVTFALGAQLDATGEAPLEITGTVTATGTEDYPDSKYISVTVPDGVAAWPVLKTSTEGLASALTTPGHTFVYQDGTYWAVRTAAKTLTAEVTEEAALSALPWKDSGNVEVSAVAKLFALGLEDVSATLNTTTAATVSVDCATVPALTLAGDAAVTLEVADGVTPAIASLTVSADSTVAATLLNGVTGATTVADGKTLSLTGTDITLTKYPVGTGAIKIPRGHAITYAVAKVGDKSVPVYSGWTTVEGALTLACELAFTQDGEANPTYPIDIAAGGTLKLATGASTYRSIQGEGDLEVTGNATFGIPSSASIEGGFAVTGNVTVEAQKTLTITNWSSTSSTIGGASFAVNGELAISLMRKDSNDVYVPVSLEIAEGKTLSGTGIINGAVTLNGTLDTNAAITFGNEVEITASSTISGDMTLANGSTLKAANGKDSLHPLNGAVTFAAGSTIDATGSYLPVIQGTITLPASGVKVKTASQQQEVLRAVAGGLNAAAFTFADGSVATAETSGLYVKPVQGSETTQKLMALLKPTTVPEMPNVPAAEQSALMETLMSEFASQASISGSAQLTQVRATGNATVEGTLLFDNVRTLGQITGSTNYEYVVSYDFGVSDITLKELTLGGDTEAQMYVLLAAKVQNSAASNTATFGANTTLTVMNGEREITPTVVDATVAGKTKETGVKWLAVPMATLFPVDVDTQKSTLGTQPLKVRAKKTASSAS